MYKGFNLKLNNFDLSKYANKGNLIYRDNKSFINNELESFKDENGDLIASEITSKWFPEIDADVFLSHSHKDEKQVICLAGWLECEFGLKSFIDSCIWGYSGDLLQIIDKKYCYDKLSKTYDYQKRNRSTSHIHMMLSTALAKMIDRCECIIFVNTPNSISSSNYINGEATDSPWIYSEIAITNIIQKRTPHRNLLTKSSVSIENIREDLNIKYNLDCMSLIPLDSDDLNSWIENNNKTGSDALDSLYDLKEIK